MTSTAKKLLFGTAGIPDSAPQTSSLSALSHIHELDLDCLEVEFVRGVKIGNDTAAKIREKAMALDIRLSVHAPYYVNLNSPEQGNRLQSHDHLLRSARMGHLCGAKCVVFHSGYYGASTPEQTYNVIKKELREVLSVLKSERNPVILRIETMGKRSQFGSLDEVLSLCQEVESLEPCLDFSHIYAREGKANSYLDFYRILKKVEKRLGRSALENIHIHISGIDFNQKGEVKHLNLEESDFHYDEWVEALKDLEVEGMVICESPGRETDARMLKELYRFYKLKS
ncbi:MAG: TIM barrel protein [Candidatus Aminicenantes bacterium]|nr:TIM barrel protein [Candidatus Aminicenantes bacterium]